MNNYPCSVNEQTNCTPCSLNRSLMCRFDIRDSIHFLMILLPLFVTAIGGVIAGGYGWWLLGWAVYMFFFFVVWEGRVLCSHCPYWAEEGKILHCHANYGVFKIWRYRPRPMSRSEQIQFLVGALILMLYPDIFLILAREFLLLAIALASAVSFGYLLWRNICDRCVNFSCPLNHVSKELRDDYLRRNPLIMKAWIESGYQIDQKIAKEK